MRAPSFWWQAEPTMAARLLAPLGRNVGQRAARRMAMPGAPAPLPVICVGNPVVGGAGKTPTALALGEIATALGLLPAFLTRGYGGALAGPVRVTARHDARAVGDEAVLLAAVGPTVVSRERVAGARLAAESGADILIMDDGFQNPSLEKTVALLVVDGAAGIGNGLVMPAGPLRAPFADQIARADALVVIGPGGQGEAVAGAALAYGVPVHRAALVPDPAMAERLAGRRIVAFAGIGRPQKFARTLHEAGAVVERLIAFGDHHVFTEAEADRLLQDAGENDLVTTAKDYARLAALDGPAYAMLRRRTLILPVALTFEDLPAAAALIESARRVAPDSTASS